MLERIKNIYFKSEQEQNAQRVVSDIEKRQSKNPNRRLRPGVQQDLDTNKLLLARATRRQVLAWGGSLAIGGVLSYLGYRGVESLGTEKNEEYRVPTKEDFFDFTDELPPSIIKDLLQERIMPHYKDVFPGTITRAGVDINVHTPILSITETDNFSDFGGNYKYTRSDQGKKVARESKRIIPYVGAMTDQEVRKWPVKTDDNQPAFDFTWDAGRYISDGITPEINLRYPKKEQVYTQHNSIIKNSAQIAKWLFVKEVSSLLLNDLAIENLVSRMKEIGQDQYVDVVESDGSIQRQEIVTEALRMMQNNKGRLIASFDIGGAYLAARAVSANNNNPSYLESDAMLWPVYNDIMSVELGETPEEVFENTMNWSGLDPKASFFAHKGDRSKLP